MLGSGLFLCICSLKTHIFYSSVQHYCFASFFPPITLTFSYQCSALFNRIFLPTIHIFVSVFSIVHSYLHLTCSALFIHIFCLTIHIYVSVFNILHSHPSSHHSHHHLSVQHCSSMSFHLITHIFCQCSALFIHIFHLTIHVFILVFTIMSFGTISILSSHPPPPINKMCIKYDSTKCITCYFTKSPKPIKM